MTRLAQDFLAECENKRLDLPNGWKHHMTAEHIDNIWTDENCEWFNREVYLQKKNTATIGENVLATMDLVNGLRLMQNALTTVEGEGKLDYALREETQTALDLVYKEIDDGWKFRVIASLMFKGFVKLQDNRERS